MPDTPKKLFMSVVVICYNGERTIARTLESLLAQDYPKRKYEIIVVDDGSTDNTASVVKTFHSVRYLQLSENQGVSGARNAGIAIAKGDIYVAFDDDCIAEPQWLSKLAIGYTKTDASGVGGYISEPQPLKGLTRKYIHATGGGCPSEAAQTGTKGSFAKRLLRYVRARILPPRPSKQAITPVEELYGANGSYPMDVIRQVGGWSREFNGIEDRDLGRRIHTQFPKKRFYAVRGANIVHDPALSLWQYLMRPYKRGPVNLKFHQRYSIFPPLFPFPIWALILATYVGLQAPIHVMTVALLAPQVLYTRWFLHFLRTGQRSSLLFPYIQMAEESMVIVGLLRGYKVGFMQSRHWARKWLRFSLFGNLLVTAAWMVMELHGPGGALQTFASLAFLLTLPGYLLLRTLVGYAAKLSLSALVTYSVGVGVIALMLIGLSVNELFVLLGRQHPLSLQPLTWAVGGVTAVAAVLATWRKPAGLRAPRLPWQSLRSNWQLLAMAVVMPFLAVGGAITLNNGGSNWLALVALGLVAAYFLRLVWSKQATVTKAYPLALYSICLTILLGTSMRGWHITGHDIMQEYQVFELTLRHAAWHMSYYQDAYNGCLSITILPTVFQRLTGLGDPFVYKFIFQLFFALIAPVLYNTLRHFTTRRTALLAVFVFLTFPAFLTDITMLNRQEVALLCFVLALQAGLDKRLGKHARLLTFVFLAGMVLSHYSTSYVATGILLLATLMYPAVRFAQYLFRVKPAGGSTIFSPPIVLAVAVLLVVWGSVVTQTSGNISRTLHGIVDGLPAIFNAAPSKQDSYSRTGQALSGQDVVDEFLQQASDTRILPANAYYANATALTSSVKAETDTVNAGNATLARHNITAFSLYRAYDRSKQLYGLAIEGLIGLGVIMILLVRRWRARLNGQYRLLILASLTIIGLQVIMPASLVNYGLLRVIQQGLIVLALPIVLACYWLLGLIRLTRRWQQRILAAGLVGSFLMLSGFLPAITGGYKPALALSNSGFYYEAYYTHAAEISADNWLAQRIPKGSQVYSDEFSRRKMIAYAGIFAQPTLSPEAIPIDSYVYLSAANTSLGIAPAYFNGGLIYYSVPKVFLQTNKTMVYNSGSVQIYR